MGAFKRGHQGIDGLQAAYEALEKFGQDNVTPAFQAMRNGVISLDDATQAAIRDHILRLPNDGGMVDPSSPVAGVRNFLGRAVHQARPGYSGDNTAYKAQNTTGDEYLGILAARGLQAGGLTAAGVGLANLTHQYQNSFGGPADSQPMTEDQYLY